MSKLANKKHPDARIQDWSRLRSDLLWAYEGKVNPEYASLPPELEPGIPIFFVREGSITIASEARSAVVKKNNWILIPQPLLLKQRDFSTDADIVSIRIHLMRPDGQSFLGEGFPQIFAHDDFPELLEHAQQLIQCIQQTNPPTRISLQKNWSELSDYLRIQEHFYAWLRRLIEVCLKRDEGLAPYGSIDDRLQQALNFLDAIPLDAELREIDVAQAASLSVSQLNRLFNKTMGETPKHYWDRRRLNAATSLLAGSALPIKQIAHDLGFSSQNYFARWFRQRANEAPRAYRERLR